MGFEGGLRLEIMKINPAPFFCGVLNPRRKRNHQTHAARLGGFKKVLDKHKVAKIYD